MLCVLLENVNRNNVLKQMFHNGVGLIMHGVCSSTLTGNQHKDVVAVFLHPRAPPSVEQHCDGGGRAGCAGSGHDAPIMGWMRVACSHH
jgi:hypothetical protein